MKPIFHLLTLTLIGMTMIACGSGSSPNPTKLCDHEAMMKGKNSGAMLIDFDTINEIAHGFPTIRQAGQNLSQMTDAPTSTQTPPC